MTEELVQTFFPYPATFVRPKKRNYETNYFLGSSAVAMRSATAEEAPVLCRTVQSTKRGREIEKKADTVRAFEDGFFLAQHRGDGFLTLEHLRSLADDPARNDWRTNPFVEIASPEYGGHGHTPMRSMPKMEDVDIRDVSRNGFSECERRLHHAATSFLVVDGIVHLPCREPVIKVVFEHYRTEFEVSFETDGAAPLTRDSVFRLDRMEDAVAYARRFRKMDESAHEENRYTFDFEIDLARPDLLRRDDLTDFASSFAAAALIEARKPVSHLTRDGMMAFADLRDAHAALMSAPSKDAATAFLTAYAEAESHCRSLVAGERDYAMENLVRSFTDPAAANLMRWREFEGGPAAELAPDDEAALGMMASG